MSDTAAPSAKPAAERAAQERLAKKAPAKRRVETGDPCLAASLFALKAGSIESAKRSLEELRAQHAETLRFVVLCGGFESALDRLDELADRLQAA